MDERHRKMVVLVSPAEYDFVEMIKKKFCCDSCVREVTKIVEKFEKVESLEESK